MKNSLIMDLITELGFILPTREPGIRTTEGVEGNENGGDGDNLKRRSYLATLVGIIDFPLTLRGLPIISRSSNGLCSLIKKFSCSSVLL